MEGIIEEDIHKSYKNHGETSKNKMLQLITDEGIIIEKSFQHSLTNSYTYREEVLSSLTERKTRHYITIPLFTDGTDIEQAFKLAHVM